jgi:hypothetical protein
VGGRGHAWWWHRSCCDSFLLLNALRITLVLHTFLCFGCVPSLFGVADEMENIPEQVLVLDLNDVDGHSVRVRVASHRFVARSFVYHVLDAVHKISIVPDHCSSNLLSIASSMKSTKTTYK